MTTTIVKDDIEKIDEIYQKMEKLQEELNSVLPEGANTILYVERYDLGTDARARKWHSEHSEFMEWMCKHNM